MLRRALGAALLRREVFIQVRERPETVVQALGVVILAGIAMASGLLNVLEGDPQELLTVSNLVDRLVGVWLAVVTIVLGWVLWGGVTFLMGSKFLGGGASFNEVLRVLGIGYGPGVLLILMSLPAVGNVVWLLTSLWILVAAVVGQRAVQGIDWFSALLSTLLGWFLFVLLLVPLLS